MAPAMMVTLLTMSRKAMDELYMLTETITSVIGRETCPTEQASTITLMALTMRAIGRMINIMAKARRSGLMALSIKDNTVMVARMAVVTSAGMTDPTSRAGSLKTKWKAMARTSGVMAANTLVTGPAIGCMVKESSLGTTAVDMSVVTLTIRRKDMVYSAGLMVDHMRVAGSMESSTVMPFTPTPQASLSAAPGAMASVRVNGVK